MCLDSINTQHINTPLACVPTQSAPDGSECLDSINTLFGLSTSDNPDGEVQVFSPPPRLPWCILPPYLPPPLPPPLPCQAQGEHAPANKRRPRWRKGSLFKPTSAADLQACVERLHRGNRGGPDAPPSPIPLANRTVLGGGVSPVKIPWLGGGQPARVLGGVSPR